MSKQGFAKKHFTEIYQRTPWLLFKKNLLGHQWPFLDILLAQQRISYLDYDLTHRLLRNEPSASQETALFICHLTLAAKEGHLCVHVNHEELYPSVLQLWKNDEGQAMSVEEAQILTQMMFTGLNQIPEELVTATDQKEAFPNTPICRNGNHFYLQRHWIYESLFLKNLKKHLNTPPALTLDQNEVRQSVDQLIQGKILTEEQAQAIIQGCQNSLTLITGGPGTGKTYTAGHLIKIFWQQLSREQRSTCQIAIVAPTGKAAANLKLILSKVTSTLEGFPSIQAKTLHSLLGLKQGIPLQDAVRLNADLVVVDESSMIDVRMMASLFDALKPGSRLILLGDNHQLPAVEAGSVFADLIQLNHSHPHLFIPCLSLSICMRAELKSLIDFAKKINEGSVQEVLETFIHSNGDGIKRLPFYEDCKDAQAKLISHIVPLYPTIFKQGQKPEQLLEQFQAIRFLSPLRKGPLGVEALNHAIWLKICQNLPMNGHLAIPIMIVANDYRQELFNGETGVLIRRLPMHSWEPEDYALFPARGDDEKVRRFAALLLPKYEFAYCLSVHKSQGSEFDHVVLALPEGSELFGREVFYTAVTRARKFLEIYGSDYVIQKTVEYKGIRLSGIEHRLSTKEWLEK